MKVVKPKTSIIITIGIDAKLKVKIKESIDFEQTEQEFYERKISLKLSSMMKYSAKIHDYLYTTSKVIR